MNSLAKVPVTVITGFLGSGKTTLIRHLLANANGKKLAVLVNEFGSEGVDGEILKSCADANCPEENIVELANGCICCTVADDFIPTIEKLLSRRGQARPHLDRDQRAWRCPSRWCKRFSGRRSGHACTVDAVIALVDGPAVAVGTVRRRSRRGRSATHAPIPIASITKRPLQELFEDQLDGGRPGDREQSRTS